MILKVNTNPEYEIEIVRGLIKEKGIPQGLTITDKNVYNLYKESIGENVLIVENGEKGKSRESYNRLTDQLLTYDDVNSINAVGGGVVGDIAGFTASTYHRGVGISLIQVPTTLLAMVDSSIGGKNGINVGGIKNVLGTIYQPKRVLIDPLFLDTLPPNEFRNGIAEIIKYSFIFGRPRLDRIDRGVSLKDEDLEYLIAACCQVKAGVVKVDGSDEGYRHTLNFGHTFAHALELLYGLSHGEAVATGMSKEAELGQAIGIIEEYAVKTIKKILVYNGLPINFPKNLDLKAFLKNIKHDKKGAYTFAFSKKDYNVKLDEKIVRTFLEDDT